MVPGKVIEVVVLRYYFRVAPNRYVDMGNGGKIWQFRKAEPQGLHAFEKKI